MFVWTKLLVIPSLFRRSRLKPNLFNWMNIISLTSLPRDPLTFSFPSLFPGGDPGRSGHLHPRWEPGLAGVPGEQVHRAAWDGGLVSGQSPTRNSSELCPDLNWHFTPHLLFISISISETVLQMEGPTAACPTLWRTVTGGRRCPWPCRTSWPASPPPSPSRWWELRTPASTPARWGTSPRARWGSTWSRSRTSTSCSWWTVRPGAAPDLRTSSSSCGWLCSSTFRQIYIPHC